MRGGEFQSERPAFLRTASLKFLASLALATLLGPAGSTVSAAAPFPMSSGNYSENFNDIANWTNNFASGIGAQYWASVPINSTSAGRRAIERG